MKPRLIFLATAVPMLFFPATGFAQRSASLPLPLLPASRPLSQVGGSISPVKITHVNAHIRMEDQLAVTTLDVFLENPSSRPEEATLVLPVPDGSVLGKFTFLGAKQEASARILPKDEARQLYDSIVAQTRDPALLEFVGTGVIQSSVFPVPAKGKQRVHMTWESLLPVEGNRIDYFLPRSEALEYRIPWSFTVEAKVGAAGLAAVYSPSHELKVRHQTANRVRLEAKSSVTPGPFLLSLLKQGQESVTASFVAYPDPKVGGGYFLMLMAPPHQSSRKLVPLRREVTLVLDRSGSMAGAKLEQVREAARQILEGLEEGEYFNLVTYNEAVELFSPEPVRKDAESLEKARKFLDHLRVSGGTNLHDALVESLRQPHADPNTVPIVLFLTDGLPTIGQTSEQAIREVAERGNPHQRRIFTFGVGVDVNTPLLNRLARESRAVATYVLPQEDVEVKVGQVFRKLSGPVLANPELAVLAPSGALEPGRLTDLLPARIPDLFAGEQLVLLGQYRGEDPLHLRLVGKEAGQERTFRFQFGLDRASTRNAWVGRLWASHKIGRLTEAIRDLGGEEGTNPSRLDELVDEVVRLSREFGILTEYTAFFAEEGTDFTQEGAVQIQTAQNYATRAIQERSGNASLNQDLNTKKQIESKVLNRTNCFWGVDLKSVEYSRVQQISDRAYYKRGKQWVDSNLVSETGREKAPDRIVTIGSPEFHTLVDQLAAANRQSCMALAGEILLEVNGQSVLIR